jgi:hypothetical protein
MMAVVAVEPDGTVGKIGVALLTGDEDKPFIVNDPVGLREANKIYADFFKSVRDEPEKTPLYGDSSNIPHHDLESLKNLYFEKIDPAKPVTARLLSEISGLSNRNGRGIGIIFDRDGKVTHVLIGAGDGTEQPLPIPALPYRRIGKLKLNGFTLIHFRPAGRSVSKDDLAELAFQRLDAVISVEVRQDGTPNGIPGKLSLAHLTDNRKKPFYIGKPATPDKIIDRYKGFIRQQ